MKQIWLTVGLVALTAAAAAEDSLTVVSWGGAYTESQQRAYSVPFTEMTGVEIIDDDSSAEGLAGIRAQVDAQQVTWNVVDVLESTAQRLCDAGYLEVISPDMLPAGDDGTPAAEDFVRLGDCFVPTIVYSTLFGYNSEAIDSAPSSVADIWALAMDGNKVGLERIPQKNMEWALMVDGVAPADVYAVLATEEGQDRAFAKLDEIKENVVWWSAGAEPPQLLADGEVVASSAFNGRLFNAAAVENQPIEIIWDLHMYELDGWSIPVGQSEAQLALAIDYLVFSTDTQRLADQAKFISYGPARASSIPLVSDHADLGIDMAPHMPTAYMDQAFDFDPFFWVDFGDALEERLTSGFYSRSFKNAGELAASPCLFLRSGSQLGRCLTDFFQTVCSGQQN